MENNSKAKAEINQKSDKLAKEIKPTLNGHPPKEIMTYAETEKDLNAKILKITMMIKEQYPELSKYVEEMPVTIPDEKNPEITPNNLKTYYDSLYSMLNKYILEHPDKTNLALNS